jgi:DNA invertase Pin-like site-specific DNA recombinase
VFHDDVSGGGDFMQRPGMVAMLRFMEAHDGYVVIFDDLKRFARDTIFHLKLRQELAAYGATVECLNFKFEDTPEGQFLETVIAAQGQLERLQNRRQTLQKMKARLERGYYVFHELRPAPELFSTARAMFEDLWNHRLETAEARRTSLKAELAKVESASSTGSRRRSCRRSSRLMRTASASSKSGRSRSARKSLIAAVRCAASTKHLELRSISSQTRAISGLRTAWSTRKPC